MFAVYALRYANLPLILSISLSNLVLIKTQFLLVFFCVLCLWGFLLFLDFFMGGFFFQMNHTFRKSVHCF